MISSTTKQLRERILLLTYIYRSLPSDFLKRVAKDVSEKKQIRWVVENLESQKLILRKKSKVMETPFISLTLKGYTYLVKQILKNPKQPFYQHKEARSLLKPAIEHSCLNFAFIWNYHKKNSSKFKNNIHVYEDSDINNCKLPFVYKGKDVLISPDVFISLPISKNSDRRNAIFVENDTGRETYKTIYQKVIEYLALAEEGMDTLKLDSISLYFVFLSKKRIQQLFHSLKGFVRFFGQFNNTNRGIEVRMKSIVKTLGNKPITIYISYYDYTKPQNPYRFQKYDLLPFLLKKEDSWEIFR